MKFSEKIKKIPASPTLEITAKAKALKAQGLNILSFSSGEPDFDTPSNIKQVAIKAIKEGKTKYTPVGGIPELKEAIVKKFKNDNNLSYKSSEVTVNCGGKHSFFNLMQVLLNPGDEVIIPGPYWVSYPPMVTLAGGKPIVIMTTAKNNFKITPQMLKDKISSKTRAVVLNSPSNPTGVAYTKKELEDLSAVIRKNILIISDDIYESILYDDFKFCNIANLSADLKERTVVLNGVSKAYSMTGWRIGYMAAAQEIIKKIEILQSQSTSNSTSISQWAALEALTGPQTALAKMNKAFLKRRDIIINEFKKIKEITCQVPNGAFYVFPNIKNIFYLPGWKKLKKQYNSKYQSTIFSSYLLDQAQVAVVPGIAFGSDNYIRISFATSEENIRQGLKNIKGAIDKLR